MVQGYAKSKHIIKKVLTCISIAVLVNLCPISNAYSTTDLPIGSWVYDALEDLAALGATDLIGLNARPISRMAAAHKVAGMIEDIQGDRLEFSLLRDEIAMNKAEDLLYKLMDELQDELVLLGVEVVSKEELLQDHFLFRAMDRINAKIAYGSYSDSAVNSHVLDNEQGWVLEEEFNARVDMQSWVSFQDFFGLRIEPAFYGSKNKNKITLDKCFFNASYKNIECGAGRTSLRWGPGRHGSMLVSNNTRPLYVANIGSQKPFRIPRIEKLGQWNIDFFTAKFIDEVDRAIKEPYLSGLRVEYSPHDRLNLSGNHTIMWGGDGVPDVSIVDLFDMFLAKLGGGGDEPENHLISITGEWAVPGLNDVIPFANGALVYCEIGAEDEMSGLPSHVGGLGGFRIIDLFLIEDLCLVMEYARTDNVWYIHNKYADGYTSRGNILGHHVGTDGDDFFVSLNKKYGDTFEVELRFDGERHGLENSVTEKKYEGGVNFKYRYLKNLILEADYEIEYFDAFKNVTGQTTKNHVIFIGGRLDF